MGTIVEILKQLGETLVDCREIPSDFFGFYGKEVIDKGKEYNLGFYIINPHPNGSPSAEDWDKENNIKAMVLEKAYQIPTRNSRCDKKPIMIAKYEYFKVNHGCVGETISRITYPSVSAIAKDTFNGWQDIVKVGRNEGFSESVYLRENEIKKGGIMKDNMKLVPSLPKKDAEELLHRFSGLLENYHKTKSGL